MPGSRSIKGEKFVEALFHMEEPCNQFTSSNKERVGPR
jgi:hypothetical protein